MQNYLPSYLPTQHPFLVMSRKVLIVWDWLWFPNRKMVNGNGYSIFFNVTLKVLMKLLPGHFAFKNSTVTHYWYSTDTVSQSTANIFPISLFLNKLGFRRHGFPADDPAELENLTTDILSIARVRRSQMTGIKNPQADKWDSWLRCYFWI